MKNIFFLLISVMMFSACTEVIEVELDEADIQIVIEGVLKDDNTQAVNISKSGNFDQNDGFDKVSNAIVTMEDESGNIWNLIETESGLYESNQSVISGNTYTINVEAEGEIYQATSILNSKVTLDSVKIEPFGPPIGNGTAQLAVFVGLQDPGDTDNYYRIRMSINDTLQAGYFVYDDFAGNGTYLERPLRGAFVESGDVLKIDLLTIDEATYNYFTSLADINGQGLNASVPYNPITNWNNNALGYFSAQAVSSRTVIVP